MRAAIGEKVSFVHKLVTAEKCVEVWMLELENLMKVSVRHCLHKAVEDYAERERVQWVRRHPGQCVLNGSQIHWTAEVEEAIQSGDLKTQAAKQTSQLLDLVRFEFVVSAS